MPPFARLGRTIVYHTDAGPARLIERLDSAGRAMPLGLEPGIKGTNEWMADRQTDTIRMTFNNAFSGSTFVLRLPSSILNPDTLYGRAYEFSDADPRETDRGAAVAVRVGCPRMSSSTPDGV